MKKNKKRFWKIVFVFSILGCLGCFGFLAWYLYQEYQVKEEYTEVRQEAQKKGEEVTLDEIDSAEFTGEQEGEEAEIEDDIFFSDMENPIDFDKLKEINPDIYAWIRIPDTNIDYPIAQREGDDSYYLKHDMYQQPRFAGCIYTEDCNSRDFTDPNTVIYGHNMKNGSMFQNLHLFADQAFFDKHSNVYIYTPKGVLEYKVFAAYTYDDRHIMNSFDFDDPEVFQSYLDEILHVRSMDANIREGIDVTVDDHIITLATCIGGQTQNRYLVQAVLL